MPVRIHGLDQANLLAATPSLDFLFPCNGRIRIYESLVIDQPGQVVTACESANELILVLKNTVAQLPR
jgi:hypothetical protein